MESSSNYVFTLSEKEKKFAEEYLNETDDSRENAFKDLKIWIKENPKLHVKPDERSLLAFLRGCKFNLDKTKTKMSNFYEMRRDRTEWFRNRNPLLLELQELANLGVFIPLRELNAENQMVVFIRVAAHNPKKHKLNDVIKVGQMILDLACEGNEMAQVYGVTAVFDLSGISLGHARQLSPSLIKNMVHAWQNYHCRPKRLEFINAPIYVNVVLNVFKGYMSEKLRGRVRVHFNTLDTLEDAVTKEVLPKEYGGSGEEISELISYWSAKLKDNAEWFAEDEMYKAEPV